MYDAVNTIMREEDIRPSEDLRREYLQTLCRGAASYSGPRLFTFRLLQPGSAARYSESKTNGLFAAAAYLGKTALIARLLVERDVLVSESTLYLGTALRCAIMQGHYDTTRTLLDAGANINGSIPFRDHALLAAASEGHRHIVELLLEPRYNCTTSGASYEKAIRRAARGGHLEIVLFMIQRGKFDNLKKLVQTILSKAAGYGQENVVQWALDNGAEVHDKIERLSNRSALSRAALNGQESVVRLLLRRAPYNFRHAALNGQESVVRLPLRRAPYNLGHAFLLTMVGGYERTARTILNAMMQLSPYRIGWSPTLQGPFGGICLILAAKYGQTHMIHFLVEKGAGLTQTEGDIARYYAERGDHESVVRALVAYGAALNSPNQNRDPLGWGWDFNHHNLARSLIQLRAK